MALNESTSSSTCRTHCLFQRTTLSEGTLWLSVTFLERASPGGSFNNRHDCGPRRLGTRIDSIAT